jgi:2,4-dienoyl-CoA reductase-like NADH-dependent reductase (Old Yellow Enzyme family)/thioredoxin reductase
MALSSLFEPIDVGSIRVKNRIVMPPITTNYASTSGEVSDLLVRHYVERARGGVGMIIVEACSIHKYGKAFHCQLGAFNDGFKPGLARLASAIKSYDVAVLLQLFHAGRQTTSAISGSQPIAPSPIPCRIVREMPREMTLEDIEDIEDSFANAAYRAKTCGFDGVEVHGAHGYLVSEFLSPYTNRRSDGYGGGVEGRARFALEIVERIREKCGSSFTVGFRINCSDFVDGGLTIDESIKIAKMLDDAGVDVIHVSAGIYESREYIVQPMYFPRGLLIPLAERIRREVSIPVIAVGRINDPKLANEAISSGRVDMVAMGRALIADPELPRKAFEGRLDDVRKCIACMDGCIGRLVYGFQVGCSINPLKGLEGFINVEKAVRPKRVLVVGAGPAGLEAARILALRGHEVMVVDRDGDIGGSLKLALKFRFKSELGELIDWYRAQLKSLNVKVLTGVEADENYVLSIKPDAVVLALGSKPLTINIPGSQFMHVVDDVLAGKVDVKDDVIVVGGGLIGCELAVHLAGKGLRVTIVEAQDDIARDTPIQNKMALLKLLREANVRIVLRAKPVEVRDGFLVVEVNGVRENLKANSIILSIGRGKVDQLWWRLKGRVGELHIIGDAVKPGKIIDAVMDGFRVGITI